MDATNTQIFDIWRGRAVGLMDLDAFFASVEQLDHPEWRGKPVIVGGSAENRGVVSTASYEARVFGVHSAMPSWKARKLCPNAIWTRGRHQRYREVSEQVMACLIDETPLVEQVSIDEAFFDVTPGRFVHESPIDICRRIQSRVADLGVTCSIGLGTSKTVAKIASERQKPRGLTVVLPGTEASFLAPLPVRAMSGIGKATESRLATMGVRTLGQLADKDPKEMQTAFGIMGPRMVARAAGREESPVASIDAPDTTKSVSHERTFTHDLTTEEQLRAAVAQMCEHVGTRLRRKGLKGALVTLKLRFDLTHTRTAQRSLDELTDDEHAFLPVAIELLHEIWVPGTPVRLVGVAMGGFSDSIPKQLSLFEVPTDEAPSQDGQLAHRKGANKLRSLSQATDSIRERFGSDALGYGRDLRLRDEG